MNVSGACEISNQTLSTNYWMHDAFFTAGKHAHRHGVISQQASMGVIMSMSLLF